MKSPVRAALALAILSGALWAGPASAAGSGQRAAPSTWAHRAEVTYSSLQQHLYQGPQEHGLYLEKTPRGEGENPHSYLWPLREAAAATVDMSELPHAGFPLRP